MHRRTFSVLVVAVAVPLTTACRSASKAPSAAGAAASLLDNADPNHDGVIDRHELDARLTARFDELDTNHDGVLDAAEFEASVPDTARTGRRRLLGRRRTPDADALFARRDTDTNGAVSFDEFRAAPDKLFDRLDTNADGRLTADERQAAREAFRRR